MASAVALVVERDSSLRRLMRAAVAREQWHVIECSTPLQLKVEAELCLPPLIEAPALLLVVSIEIARQCTEELARLLKSRMKAGAPSVSIAFTCEFGAPQEIPSIGSYALAGILEKPFALDELQSIARGCQAQVGVASSP